MKRVPAAVVTLGLASLLTDLSAEMIFPLLPAFLTGTLGAGAAALGLIEGVAEATAATFKVISGVLTDRSRRRKPLVLLGYTIAGAARPLVGLARNWSAVLLIRFADRIGKGLRTSPRDALIADVTPPSARGAAYGLHRAMDHSGAVLGPLVAAALLHFAGLELRTVFLLAGVPAAFVVVTLAFGVRERAPEPEPPAGPPSPPALRDLPRDYRRLLLVLFVATLGNSTDAFLLLRLQAAGVPVGGVALLWALHHLVRVPATWWGGRLVDRFGPRPMLLLGWIVYAWVYAGFAWAGTRAAIAIFLAYGLYYGLSEPAERAWIAALAPGSLRGRAFGIYHAVTGLALFPASVLFGLVWSAAGPEVAFLAGATLSVAASGLLLRVPPPRLS